MRYDKIIARKVILPYETILPKQFRFDPKTQIIKFDYFLSNTCQYNLENLPKIRKLIILMMHNQSWFFHSPEHLTSVTILIFKVNRRSTDQLSTFDIGSFPCNVKKMYFIQKKTTPIDLAFHANDTINMCDFPESLEYLHVRIIAVLKHVLKNKMPDHITSLDIPMILHTEMITINDVKNLPSKLLKLKIGLYFEETALDYLPKTLTTLSISSNISIDVMLPLEYLCENIYNSNTDLLFCKTLKSHVSYFNNQTSKTYLNSITTLIFFNREHITHNNFPRLENVIIDCSDYPTENRFDVTKLKNYILKCHIENESEYPEWLHQYVLERQGNKLNFLRIYKNAVTELSFHFYENLPRIIKFYDTKIIRIQTPASNTYDFPENTKCIYFNKNYPESIDGVKNKLKLPKLLKMFIFYSQNHLLEFNTNLPFLEYVCGNDFVKARHVGLYEDRIVIE